MKPLKDLGVDFKELKAAVAALNGSDLCPTKINVVGCKGELVLEKFLLTVHAVQEDKVQDLPIEVRSFYSALPEEVFTEDEDPSALDDDKAAADAPTDDTESEEESGDATEEASTEGIALSDCPTFGAQDLNETDCQECETAFPSEFIACAAKTAGTPAPTPAPTKADEKAAAKAAKEEEKAAAKATKDAEKAAKAAAKAADKAPKAPKAPVVTKRSRYGHVIDSMSGDVDDLVWKGTTLEDMVLILMKKHNKPDANCRAKVRGHVNHLIQNKLVTVAEVDGLLKSSIEFIAGREAGNTIDRTDDLLNLLK